MRDCIRVTNILCWVVVSIGLSAQSAYRVHSHNDYLQPVPFWQAYAGGAASIEVDVLMRDDTLYVAHGPAEIERGRTFERLYLAPLVELASRGELRPIQLLIDVKSEAYATLDRVVRAITEHKELTGERGVDFVISGNRPAPTDYERYPDFIYFDHQDLSDLYTIDLSKVALISQSFQDYSVYNGYGRMTAGDATRVRSALARAREAGKPFRFWATPDTKTAWARFAGLGVAFINTDKPTEAVRFLEKLDRNSYAKREAAPTYAPAYRYDEQGQPKNIILMVGDGNGLAQISAAMVANQGKLTLAQLRHIGLITTSSADDLVTDSAAAGTALSTGKKTNNRAIGVDPYGKNLSTIVEILSAQGYNTGIITTDAMDGATPSAFYAHTDDRGNSDKIIADLRSSELDLLISGGRRWQGRLEEKFMTTSLDELETLDRPTAIYNGYDKMPSVVTGRGDFIATSVRKGLAALNNAGKPFFLLIEGAQIDNGGHANDITAVITEILDFDGAVGEAIQFADATENTLVVITADHETGGLGVAGSNGAGSVRADFLSVDHTGIMVPVFAYGPGAGSFTGVLDNTEIFERIMMLLKSSR